MSSIIIDEILPTKWRLRLRDADGKTREVEYRAGTPLELDSKVDGDKSTGREKAATPTKDRPASKPAARETKATKEPKAGKGRAKDTATKEPEPPKAEVTKKPDPEPPPVRRRKPEPGAGPGALVWEETEDDGLPGIRAPFGRGAFKILHAGGDAFALFYEWNSGKYQSLSCGALEALKQAAAQWTEDGKLQPPRSNLGVEAAKVACAVQGETPVPTAIPPTLPTTPPTPAPAVDPEKDKALMQGFEATVQKLLAAKKGSP